MQQTSINKTPLVSVRKSDLRIDFYKGTGCGGQKKNKTSNCCRITHLDSGAVGKSEEGRSQRHNRDIAFKRMANTPIFQLWLKRKSHEAIHNEEQIEAKVEKQMEDSNLRVEHRINGKWI
jgi:protein subunit release factor A